MIHPFIDLIVRSKLKVGALCRLSLPSSEQLGPISPPIHTLFESSDTMTHCRNMSVQDGVSHKTSPTVMHWVTKSTGKQNVP